VFTRTALFALALASLTGCGAAASRSSKTPEPGFHSGLVVLAPARDPEPPAAANVREPNVPAVAERTYEGRSPEIQCWQCE
jgi:hypothetical protein